MDNKLLNVSIRNSLLAVIYIFAVSQLIFKGDIFFGALGNTFLGPFALLLLFSASAAMVGGLVFGQAIMLFLDGKKKESIQSALYSVGCLMTVTLLIFALLYLFGAT